MEEIKAFVEAMGITIDFPVVMLSIILTMFVMSIVKNISKKKKKKLNLIRLSVSPLSGVGLTFAYHMTALNEPYTHLLIWNGICNAMISTGFYEYVRDFLLKTGIKFVKGN